MTTPQQKPDPAVKTFQEATDIVKSSLDIIDLVSRFVVLKKSGRNYTGLCPFHKDRNPSFSVSREKNLYKCFSCGEGGDALGFMMKIENKTFGQVIRDLAEEQGIIIREEGQNQEEVTRKRDLNQKILELNTLAQQWYEKNLTSPQGQPVRDYLTGRDITGDTVTRFGLGFALPGWESLTQHLLKSVDFARHNPDLLITAGISNARREGNGYYDRFRNRLTVPIHDDTGRIVGFGGRALGDDDKPKYLNTPETALYQKSRILYGLFQAKDTIRDTRSAVVMEGYFDVISAHIGGITQAVGSCGTALTDQHLKLLTRFGAETIYLAFDSDEAGLKAALSAIELIEPYLNLPSTNLAVRIVIVPDGKDPDDFIRQHGGPAFQNLMDYAMPHLDFKFEQALTGLDLHQPDGRVQGANRLTPLLAAIQQPVLRREYLDRYADRIGVRPDDLALELQRHLQIHQPRSRPAYGGSSWKKQNDTKNFGSKRAISKGSRTLNKRTGSQFPEKPLNLSKRPVSKLHEAEKALFRLLFLNEQSFGVMEPLVKKHQFTDNVLQSLAGYLQQVANPNGTQGDSLSEVIQRLSSATTDQPELQHTLTDLVFSAEKFADSLQLDTLSPAEAREMVLEQAELFKTAIRVDQLRQNLALQRQKVKELERTKRDVHENTESEVPQLELQYQHRDALSQTRNELL